MSAISWRTVEGQEFLGEEAREASDFSEIVYNLGLDAEEAYEMFKNDRLTIGKRLYFAVSLPTDKAVSLLLLDSDARIGMVVKGRLGKEREEVNGPIIVTG